MSEAMREDRGGADGGGGGGRTGGALVHPWRTHVEGERFGVESERGREGGE